MRSGRIDSVSSALLGSKTGAGGESIAQLPCPRPSHAERLLDHSTRRQAAAALPPRPREIAGQMPAAMILLSDQPKNNHNGVTTLSIAIRRSVSRALAAALVPRERQRGSR